MKISFDRIILLFVLLSIFVLTACGDGNDSNSSSENDISSVDGENNLTKAFHIGLNTWGTAPVLQLYGEEAAFAIETLGMTYNLSIDDYDPEKEVKNIQDFISQGVDGLCVQGAGVTTIPQISNEAKQAKTPFVLYIFTGSEEVRAELSADNEYYAGAVASDLQADGRVLAEKAILDGCKTACLIGGNTGDLNMDNRSKGFTEAFEVGGGKVLSEARCVDNTEALSKASDMLSNNEDVDAIYIMAGDYVEGTFEALNTLGINNTKSYLSSVTPASADYIRDGKIVAGSGGAALGANIAPTLLLNMLDGQTIKDDDGNVPFFQIPTSLITKDNVDAYVEVFYADDSKAISSDVLKKLCYRYNDTVSYQTYVEAIANDLSVDAIIEAAGK